MITAAVLKFKVSGIIQKKQGLDLLQGVNHGYNFRGRATLLPQQLKVSRKSEQTAPSKSRA